MSVLFRCGICPLRTVPSPVSPRFRMKEIVKQGQAREAGIDTHPVPVPVHSKVFEVFKFLACVLPHLRIHNTAPCVPTQP